MITTVPSGVTLTVIFGLTVISSCCWIRADSANCRPFAFTEKFRP
jgi:hypothetical protein